MMIFWNNKRNNKCFGFLNFFVIYNKTEGKFEISFIVLE